MALCPSSRHCKITRVSRGSQLPNNLVSFVENIMRKLDLPALFGIILLIDAYRMHPKAYMPNLWTETPKGNSRFSEIVNFCLSIRACRVKGYSPQVYDSASYEALRSSEARRRLHSRASGSVIKLDIILKGKHM